jgi:hypothetical protein
MCFPSFSTYFGRLLATYVMSWVILVGPITNIIGNLKQLAMVVPCTGVVLKIQPQQFRLAMVELQRELISALYDHFEFVRTTIASLQTAADHVYAGVQTISYYMQHASDALDWMVEQCNGSWISLIQDCKEEAGNLYDECEDSRSYYPLLGSACLPYSLGQNLCANFPAITACEVIRPVASWADNIESTLTFIKMSQCLSTLKWSQWRRCNFFPMLTKLF